jgi:hypothetical protein
VNLPLVEAARAAPQVGAGAGHGGAALVTRVARAATAAVPALLGAALGARDLHAALQIPAPQRTLRTDQPEMADRTRARAAKTRPARAACAPMPQVMVRQARMPHPWAPRARVPAIREQVVPPSPARLVLEVSLVRLPAGWMRGRAAQIPASRGLAAIRTNGAGHADRAPLEDRRDRKHSTPNALQRVPRTTLGSQYARHTPLQPPREARALVARALVKGR